ncbi:AMSH-like ubiquitin thioesterase [Sporobolomyces salmoneus]|uniref:AMSH-like ubiquitin thioesterase n=1 Tax=Sporobolomyces salmoneus TaxID=183962 RepID=UPI00317170AE
MPLLRKRKKETAQASASQPPLPSPPPSRNPTPHTSTSRPSPSTVSPPTDVLQPPRSFAELEDLVEEVVSASWDASIAISSWRRALSQLAQEAKVYYNEGNIDLAFVRSATVLKLASQVLPRYHPDWPSLNPSQKVDIAKLASDYSQNYNSLKDQLLARSAAYYASIRTSQGYNPALSLRNTVQPSSMSMTESGKSEEYYRSMLQREASASSDKKGEGDAAGPRRNKLRKAFGMRGRTDSQRSVGSSKDLEGAIRTQLPAPGTEEKEGELESMKSSHDPFLDTAPPVSLDLAPSTGIDNLPLPGEDDSDVEYEDETRTSITYAVSNPIAPTPDWSQLPSTYAPTPHLPPTHSSSSYAYSYPYNPDPRLATRQEQFSNLPASHPTQPHYDPSSQPYTQAPTPPLRPPLPPTPPVNFRSHATNSTPAPVLPKPPIPPLPPQFAPALTPISTPFLIPMSPSAPSERSSSTDTSATSLRLATVIPPQPSAPPSQSSSSQFGPGYADSLLSPTPSSTPSLHRSSSIASVPPELYGLSTTTSRRSSRRSAREGRDNRASGLSNLQDIGEALPENSGSEKGSSVEEEVSAWIARTEAGNPLRPIFLPIGLVSHFVEVVARRNTEKNIETCGLLLGHLSRNEFTVTTLLIPQQDGTPDTCVTTHEEEQFEFQDSKNLMTLGWIHTHPTQSIFLSSVDLHCQASYQILLQEAIAIVCAPRHDPDFGIFRLTDTGLETIVQCNDKSLFHPHPDLPLYTDVDADFGHCRLRNYDFETYDLRRN